jgi:cytochrome c5
MAEQEKHSSQSIMWVSIVAAIALMAVAVPFGMKSKSGGTAANDDADARIAPIATVAVQAAPKGDGKARDGETVYNTVCTACHGSGALGAPKLGDKAAWAPRLGQGIAGLLKSATNGKNAMPARGGAADLTDAELKGAVEYMAGKAK